MREQNFHELLTHEEIAARLKVPASWVYEKTRKRCQNPIPSIPMGRYIRFDWDAVVKWLEEQAKATERSDRVQKGYIFRKGPSWFLRYQRAYSS